MLLLSFIKVFRVSSTAFVRILLFAIIIIIIINEKINVAFSRRTARTRNSHKKHKPRKRRV